MNENTAAGATLSSERPVRAAVYPGPQPGWLVSAKVDLLVVFGLGAALSVLLYSTYRIGSGFIVVAALFAVVSDFPHVLQTSARMWLDPDERELHGRHFTVSLVVIAAAVAALAVTDNFRLVIGVFVLWQVLHVVKQHIGIVSIYAAKAGYRGSRTLAKRALIFGAAAPVVYRMADGLTFGHYEINGKALPFSEMTVPLPPIPLAVVVAAYAVGVVFVGLFIREQLMRRASGEGTMPGVALLTIGVAIGFYGLSYHLVSDPYALILIATTFHSLQYHLISWARNRGRFHLNGREGEEKLLLARLSTPRALALLALVLVLAGGLLSSAETMLLGIIPFSIVLHHFYFDAFAWKPKRNPALGKHLSLRPPPRA